MRRFLFVPRLCLACLVLTCAARAQTHRFKTYTSSTGLPNNSIYAVYQDPDGYMWFATDRGVCRFDGASYKTYSLSEGLVDASVRGVFGDREGNCWIVTRGGVSRWNGSGFTNFTTAEGLPHSEIRCGLCARDGRIWLGTAAGISCWDGRRFVNYGLEQGLPRAPVWAMIEDRDGTLWLGLRGGGLVKFDGKTFVRLGPERGFTDENVFGLAQGTDGVLWLATDGGLCRYDGSGFRHYTTKDGLGNDSVSSVLVDRRGRVWCGTFGGGAARLEGDRFTVFNRAVGLPDNFITSLHEDFEGNVWFGTRWGGVSRLSNEMFSIYDGEKSVGEGLVTGVAEAADGAVWFSTINNGLARLAPDGSIRRYGVREGLLEDALWTVFIDRRGRIWTGGMQGLSCLDGDRIENFSGERIGKRMRVVTIAEDRQGRIWFGDDSGGSPGVFVHDGQTFRLYSTDSGLMHNQVGSLVADRDGRIWACTEGGLCSFDGEKFVPFEHPLPDRHVQCAYQDEQGRLWIGTSNGLALFDGKTSRAFLTEDGLVFNGIRAITGANGLAWIGTSKGVSSFDGTRFRNYTTGDGLASNDITRGAGARTRDGNVWFGTTEGALLCRPERDIGVPPPPRVHITAVHIQERALNLTPKKGEISWPAARLAHDENTLTFDFVGISFRNEDAVEYDSILEEFDSRWSPPSRERSVRFTNLPPGRYRFLVKARSASGVWSEPQAVEIMIRKPYWQTWWFRLAVAAAVGLAGYGAYAWRIRDLESEHRRRLAELRKLLESIRIINSELALDTVLQSIAEESARLVGGEPGGIGLVEDGRVVFRRLWLDKGWKELSVSFALGEGVAGRVAASAVPLIVNDADHASTDLFPELVRKHFAEGFMDVPIMTRTGTVVGVLNVRRRVGRAPFDEADCALVASLADQAAIAIENAGLYGELEQKNLVIGESFKELERLYKQEQDVSQRLQELNRMKTNFLIVTSHEIRTPLTVLKGYNEALIGEFLGPLSDPQRRSLASCQRMVERMTTTFNDLLEMLQINEGCVTLAPEPFDLGVAVREVVDEMASFVEQRRQRVVIDVPSLVVVTGDRGKIRLALENVVQNAVKFTADDGVIRIDAEADDESVHIRVVDSGIGIEAAEIERIFDRFYTSPDTSTHKSGRFEFAARGTGLGLAIAKSHVEAHGGSIWAESAGAGKGSCFHIVLPLAFAAKTDSTPAEGFSTVMSD